MSRKNKFKLIRKFQFWAPKRVSANGFGLGAGRVSDALNFQPTTNLQKNYRTAKLKK